MTGRVAHAISGRERWSIRLAAAGIALNGCLYLMSVLLVAVRVRPSNSLHYDDLLVPIIIGLTLLYVSRLIARHKRAAWNLTVALYLFALGYTVSRLPPVFHNHHLAYPLVGLLHTVVLPIIILGILLYYRDAFTVRSDVANFASSLRFVAVILCIALVYGTSGFLLLDRRDFGREISFPSAIHYTLDQFNITTGSSLQAHTKRSQLFLESLSVVSAGAAFYAIVTFFQPLRARYGDTLRDRRRVGDLLAQSKKASSEDIFKLWPHDKIYFLQPGIEAAFAYKVERGVALHVGDPVGTPSEVNKLWPDFSDFCRLNDWLPAFVHTEPHWNNFYKQHGFKLQKIGEEAVVDLAHFDESVRRNKYFRHIGNKFTKLGYTTEILPPPHNDALLHELDAISQEWLALPGRSERTFMMGFASHAYYQQNALAVVRDEQGRICAFMNQVTSYDHDEINFDLLRHRTSAPGNINDFLMLAFMQYASDSNFRRLNLGLTPLSGIDDESEEPDSKLINSTLRFVYSNGDRFYSFSGLHRFKSKYEPEWQNRYIAYKGNVAGFTRAINALNKAWQLPKR